MIIEKRRADFDYAYIYVILLKKYLLNKAQNRRTIGR